jgi:hypothetical protein
MGIIINYTTRTVQGLNPGLTDYPVAITTANDVTVAFGGEQNSGPWTNSIEGTINRVTGDLSAASMLFDHTTSKVLSQTLYTLQCRPAQRMF